MKNIVKVDAVGKNFDVRVGIFTSLKLTFKMSTSNLYYQY